MNWKKRYFLKEMIPFHILMLILLILSFNFPFFFDTIQLGSKHATWYYSNNLRIIHLPDAFDSGHPPTFGYLLAIVWKLFGRNIWSSHLFMAPFLFGLVVQSYWFLRYFLGIRLGFWGLLIFFADATLIGQSLLVSPDIPLVFFFLLSINGLLYNKNILLALGLIGLSLISMRGMMCLPVIGIFHLYHNGQDLLRLKKESLVKLLMYLPAFCLALGFLIWHYNSKGWIGYHKDSEWAYAFVLVDPLQMVKNWLIVNWRFIDFGRIFLYLFGLYALYKLLKKRDLELTYRFRRLIALLFISLHILTLSAIMFKELSAHRYLLPIMLIFSALWIKLIFYYFTNIKKVSIILAILLISGWLWVYPQPISTGWDSTPAHITYYNQRKEAINFLEGITDINSVGSAFPNISGFYYTDLFENNNKSFKKYDLDNDKHIMYSNVFNDFTKSDLEKLSKDYKVIWEKKSLTTFVSIYERKN